MLFNSSYTNLVQIKILHGFFILLGVVSTGASLSLLSLNANATGKHSLSDNEARYTLTLSLPAYNQKHSAQETANKEFGSKIIKVKKGDTISDIFNQAGLGQSAINEVLALGKKAKRLTQLVPGQTLEFKLTNDKLSSLTYTIDPRNKINVYRNNDQLNFIRETREYEKRVTYAAVEIRNSLFEAAQKAELPESVTMDLAYIFGWDVDFALDIRNGDSFTVLYEELYLDRKKIKYGDIIAAEFTTQGKTFKAIRYTDPKGRSDYYSPDGKSMRKAFLRTPVDFTRISSRYGNRKHPTLKKWKKHKGVDYAAPRGTPVKTSGSGKIVHRATKGAYGKTVIVDHGNGYKTLYAHLNNYNRKARNGRNVKQGQVIGYVGSTGRATGPHLHYEFRVRGKHRNPLTVKLPDASSIAKKYRADFNTKAKPLLAQLDMVKSIRVATLSF